MKQVMGRGLSGVILLWVVLFAFFFLLGLAPGALLKAVQPHTFEEKTVG